MAERHKKFPTKRDSSKAKDGLSRRIFLKKALISGVAMATTVSLAKKVSTLAIPDLNPQKLNMNDVIAGDIAMAQKKYILMTKREKEDLVQFFVENYQKDNL